MVWSFLRVSIFVIAFFIGMKLAGPDNPVSSAAISIPQIEEKAGTAALVVSCETGNVTITQFNKDEAIQFECARGDMVVIRDHSDSLKKIPELRLLRHQLFF